MDVQGKGTVLGGNKSVHVSTDKHRIEQKKIHNLATTVHSKMKLYGY